MRRVVTGLVFVASFVPGVALAQEPRLEVTVPVELQFDGVYDSADRDGELADTYTTIEPAITFHLGKGFSIEGALTYEPINDPTNDRFFSNQGLYVNELYLRYGQDRFTLFAGKFAPAFGAAWDLAPGLYGGDFADDYELTERVGFGGAADLTGPGGSTHTITANTFYQDHSGLSRSWFHRRAQTRESDGGASNTGDLSSMSATLTGPGPGLLSSLNYQISYDHLAAGQGNANAENAIAFALFGESPIWDTWTLEQVVELGVFKNAKAAAEDRTYATLGLTLRNGPWDFNAAYAVRAIDPDAVGLANTNDELFQVGFGRDILDGLNVSVGYKYDEQSDVDSHTFGLLLSYEFGFTAL